MLLRISCVPCRLGSLWTDEPEAFLATICRRPMRCQATLHDERFGRNLVPPSTPAEEPEIRAAEPAA